MEEKLLKPKDAAESLSVTTRTLRNWEVKGTIKAVRLPSGVVRYPESEIERLKWNGVSVGEENGR